MEEAKQGSIILSDSADAGGEGIDERQQYKEFKA
jgi:hypothetical protein